MIGAARGRLVAVLGALAGGGLGVLAATQPWGSATLVDGRALEVAGQEAAGALVLLALSSVALGLVLAIARPRGRVVLGVLAVVLGGLTIAQALAGADRVDDVLHERIADATGLSGAAQAAEVAALALTGWPTASVVGGAIVALVGAWALLTGARWPERGQRSDRYERTGSGLAWDVMDDGEDPTR